MTLLRTCSFLWERFGKYTDAGARPAQGLGSLHNNPSRPLAGKENAVHKFMSFDEWLEEKYVKLAGAEGEEGEAGGEAGEGGEGGEEGGESGGSAGGEGSEEGGSGGEDDELGELRQQLAKTKADLTAAQRAARQARQEARQQRDAAAQESGDWEKVAKERESEISDLREQLAEAADKATASEFALDKFQRKVRVASIASTLHFRDPADAIAMLNEDDTDDDKSAERALRKLAEKKPYLVDQRKASGRGMNGGSGAGAGRFTKEQLENMKPDEVNANWETIAAALTSGGAT